MPGNSDTTLISLINTFERLTCESTSSAAKKPLTAMDDDSRDAEALQKRWTGGELLLCVAIQLVLVNVAYRVDRRQQAPLVSTSAWAIFFGLVVRLHGAERIPSLRPGTDMLL
jgi:hypothetical protein